MLAISIEKYSHFNLFSRPSALDAKKKTAIQPTEPYTRNLPVSSIIFADTDSVLNAGIRSMINSPTIKIANNFQFIVINDNLLCKNLKAN